MNRKQFLQNMLTSAVIGIVLCGFAACGSKVADTSEDQAFQRINKTKVLRVGYASNPPNLIVDPNTKKISGIMHDVLEIVAKNMGMKVEYVEEVSWATMSEALDSGRVDIIVAGVWPSPARARQSEFSTSICFSVLKTYVRQGDNRFDGHLALINDSNIKIATLDGEMSSIIARTDFPKAQTVSLPQTTGLSQLILQVQSGKADVTFVEPSIAFDYIEKNPNQIQEVQGVNPLRVFPNTFLYAKSELKLCRTIDVCIQELHNSGAINEIINKYEKFPGEFLRVTLPYQSPMN